MDINQTSLVDWLTAIGTIGAVLVSLGLALYLEIWKPKRQRARFSISTDPTYSFSVDTSEYGIMEMIDGGSGEEFTRGITRFRVEHIKGGNAKNVEIFVSKIWNTCLGDENKNPFENFYPSNLLWSGNTNAQTIKADFAPRVARFCDFGVYAPDGTVENIWMLKLRMPNCEGEPAYNKFSNCLYPGKYQIELLISGENVEPTTSQWTLTISGGWNMNEKEMFEKHCIIKRI